MKVISQTSNFHCRVKVTNSFVPVTLILLECMSIYGGLHLVMFGFSIADSAVFAIILMFVISIGSFILPVIILNKIVRYQYCDLRNNGLYLDRKGFVPFGSIKSYDTDASAFGETARLYLHLRPRKGMAFRLTPSLKKDERRQFMHLCLAFQRRMEQTRALGMADAPVQQSFWGSRRAKAVGLFGLVLEAAVLVGVLVFAPHMLSYAGYALIVSTPVFLAILAGKRSR